MSGHLGYRRDFHLSSNPVIMELVFQVGTQRHRESKDNDLNPTASKQKSWVCLTPKPAGVPASRTLPQLCGTCP